MTGRRLLIAFLLLAIVPAAGSPAAAPAQTGPVCGSNNPLTLIGIDSAAGNILFSSPPAGKGEPWLIELKADGSRARARPDRSKGRFGGSVGPGPILAALPCGDSCVQPVRWTGDLWEPLGDPLRVSSATNVSPTYDRTGAPWFLIHSSTREAGRFRVQAFRFDGSGWRSRGELEVTAVGQPSALPAPQRKDGVLSGTGLFSASGRPEVWVAGIPSLPASRRGQLIALTGTAAAYLSGDGVVYLSEDSGKRWRRSTWTPWGSSEGTVGIWRQGNDWWVDLPFGDHEGSLRLVWFDRRIPSEEKVLFTRLTQSGDWVRLAETRSELRTRSESLGISQILVPKGNTWILLTGCVAVGGDRGGSSLVFRLFDGKSLSDPKMVRLE